MVVGLDETSRAGFVPKIEPTYSTMDQSLSADDDADDDAMNNGWNGVRML